MNNHSQKKPSKWLENMLIVQDKKLSEAFGELVQFFCEDEKVRLIIGPAKKLPKYALRKVYTKDDKDRLQIGYITFREGKITCIVSGIELFISEHDN